MVKKIFWKDPYQTELITSITSVNGNDVTVKETIFYAFSGGQESDAGTINGYKVIKAVKLGLEIIYTLDNHDLQVYDEVIMKIDWNRRYQLMKLHFAAEIVLELVNQNLHIEKIGAHISEDKSRIDFIFNENISIYLPFIEEKANQLIKENKPIISSFCDEKNERRTWHVDGFSTVQCGGTHLKSTGEIGYIHLKRVNIGKGKERIEIYLDKESYE